MYPALFHSYPQDGVQVPGKAGLGKLTESQSRDTPEPQSLPFGGRREASPLVRMSAHTLGRFTSTVYNTACPAPQKSTSGST